MQKNYLNYTKQYLSKLEALQPIASHLKKHTRKDAGIKALVFDIYGTLIISASGDLDKAHMTIENIDAAITASGCFWVNPRHQKEAEMLLQRFHYEVENHQAILKEKGHPYPEVDILSVWNKTIAHAVNHKWLVKTASFNVKTLTVVFELLSNPVWPMPEMNEMLMLLKNSHYPLGIVSNAQFYTPLIMNYFTDEEISQKEELNNFDPNISLFSYKELRSKPDVFLFEKLAKRLDQFYNIKPNEVIFVGNDMLKDVWTASQCGFKTVLFAGDTRSLKLRKEDSRCENLQADYTITHLNQLKEILQLD